MIGFQRRNVPASHSEDDKDSQIGWKKNEGGKKPKSVACNEMRAEGMEIRSWWLDQAGDECIYICMRVCVVSRCRVPVCVWK